MSTYEEVIKSGIIFRRPFRVLSNLFYVFRSGPKTGKPFMLKFENSTLCNLKCQMCPLNKGLKRKTGILSFEKFKRIYDEINPPYLNLTGIGEPLLNPDIFKIIKYGRLKGSVVKIDTNGTLLTKENIRKLIHAEPSFVSISIDSVDKKTYEKIRKGAKFEEVIDNFKKFIQYRNKVGSKTKIHLFFVLQESNILELPEFIRFGDENGVDSINGTVVISMGDNKNEKNRKIDLKKISKVKKEFEELKKKVSVNLNLESIEDFFKNPNGVKKESACFWPWYQTSITWDGDLNPCCIFCDNEVVFGNVFKEPFMKIWNNKKAQEFRKQLVKKREGICESCGVDESFIYDKLKPLYRIPLLNKISYRN